MRKTFVIASREYQAAVRTKTFLIGLLMMPLLMGGSALLQWLLKDYVNLDDKHFVLVDRADRSDLVQVLQDNFDDYNQRVIFDSTGERQLKPRLLLEVRQASAQVSEQRYEISEEVREGDYVGFLEILNREQQQAENGGPAIVVRYQSNMATYPDFANLAEKIIAEHLRKDMAKEIPGLTEPKTAALLKPAVLHMKGLATRDAAGNILDDSEQNRLASIIIPMVMMILMFMITLMGSTPLMQSVVEEKMQRIAEVLLGSVQPFPLMMGKLIGMAAVSLTVSAVYLGGAFWAAHHFGVTDYLTPGLLIWFVIFQALASLMFGSLFIAVGAACTEMKETQNLMWPVMLMATMPMFLLGQVLRDPNGPAVRGLSFFPFATPSLMIARQAIPPGIPVWEPIVGAVIVLVSTVFCVWAAGRIFRIGILLQGKGANMGEMMRWVFRG